MSLAEDRRTPRTHPAQPHSTLSLLAKSSWEGVVVTKRSFAGSGVQDDIGFRVSNVLKGPPSLVEDVIEVGVRGGYAPDDRDGPLCLRDEISDGIRVQVGSSYVLPLSEEADADVYRAEDLGGRFCVSDEGELVSLTPALAGNKLLPVLKISDLEKGGGEGAATMNVIISDDTLEVALHTFKVSFHSRLDRRNIWAELYSTILATTREKLQFTSLLQVRFQWGLRAF